jgi:heme/copper-type cytochrome/quinol oxidase subunit 3
MLFFPFFWAFFHFSLAPVDVIGSMWPPLGIKFFESLDPFMLPVLNTVTLLCSGVTIINAHRAIITGYKTMLVNSMFAAILYGLFFSLLQLIEYCLTKYTINDGTFGSVFFMLTGLHGFHVIVGTVLLTVAYVRIVNNTFSTHHHVGFEAAA